MEDLRGRRPWRTSILRSGAGAALAAPPPAGGAQRSARPARRAARSTAPPAAAAAASARSAAASAHAPGAASARAQRGGGRAARLVRSAAAACARKRRCTAHLAAFATWSHSRTYAHVTSAGTHPAPESDARPASGCTRPGQYTATSVVSAQKA
jgi:hypothetical protein